MLCPSRVRRSEEAYHRTDGDHAGKACGAPHLFGEFSGVH